MSAEPQRTCPSCGNEFSGAMEFCPVCVLRKAPADAVESGESFASADTAKRTTPQQAVQRFEHYELVKGEDGKPFELGRGAMGVTYKAFDVDLRCPVTLKVISGRYLADESARLRFSREARAAASVRHPNVASVFHLGRTGENYFYAMEFVEGETLENLIKRSGRLEIKAGAGNRDAGRYWFGCGAQAEASSSGHQTKQHHGELGGWRRCGCENHRPRIGQIDQ
jgi:Protein kinase domain